MKPATNFTAGKDFSADRRRQAAPWVFPRLFSLIAWLVAGAVTSYVLALYPLANMLGSGIAGARGYRFQWGEFLLVASPLLLVSASMGAAAVGMRRGRNFAARLYAAALAVLIAIDGLLLVFYPGIRPWGALDYRPVRGLHLGTWQFLDSLFFSAWVTGTIFVAALLAFIVWFIRPANRAQLGQKG
jgi:hypothetical protein